MKKEISGVITALITPFDSSGGIDWKVWRELIDDQIDAGVSGIIPCGTTGESPALTLDEKKLLISSAVERCQNTLVNVIAGTGSNSTLETVELSSWASQAGVDGVLVVSPYDNKPLQRGLITHFTSVANAVNCPLLLYNVPGRTGVSLNAETIASLAAHPRIRHIKEATGNVELTSEILEQCQLAGRSITVLSGDDATYLPLLSVGAQGVISVASNLFPRALVALQQAWDSQMPSEARKIHTRFYPLFRDLFVESNPAPIKAAMAWIGKGSGDVRRPLSALSESGQSRLISSLVRCGLKEGGGTQ